MPFRNARSMGRTGHMNPYMVVIIAWTRTVVMELWRMDLIIGRFDMANHNWFCLAGIIGID